jgi:hypothetical protein
MKVFVSCMPLIGTKRQLGRELHLLHRNIGKRTGIIHGSFPSNFVSTYEENRPFTQPEGRNKSPNSLLKNGSVEATSKAIDEAARDGKEIMKFRISRWSRLFYIVLFCILSGGCTAVSPSRTSALKLRPGNVQIGKASYNLRTGDFEKPWPFGQLPGPGLGTD